MCVCVESVQDCKCPSSYLGVNVRGLADKAFVCKVFHGHVSVSVAFEHLHIEYKNYKFLNL